MDDEVVVVAPHSECLLRLSTSNTVVYDLGHRKLRSFLVRLKRTFVVVVVVVVELRFDGSKLVICTSQDPFEEPPIDQLLDVEDIILLELSFQ